MEGYRTYFPKKNVIHVFSIPNHLYRCGNQAAFVRVNESLERQVTWLEPAEETQSTKYNVSYRDQVPRFR